MSLRDDLNSVVMQQTSDYKEEPTGNSSTKGNINTRELTDSVLASPDEKKEKKNPFKHKKDENAELMDNKKKLIIAGSVIGGIVFLVCFGLGFHYITKDRGTAWMQEIEEGELPTFEYSAEERAILRENGYTGDDIERFEVEERDYRSLVKEAEEARKLKYETEILPYLDGASPQYKELERLTWLGTGDMSSVILTSSEGQYEQRYGSYNCDYVKLPAKGSQLFIKLTLMDFNNKEIFMTVTPERYNELQDTGNIVVTIEYYRYSDGSILVHSVYEKDIKG